MGRKRCRKLCSWSNGLKLDDIEKVHPMKQIAVASVVQAIMLGFMGLSMYLIGVFFSG